MTERKKMCGLYLYFFLFGEKCDRKIYKISLSSDTSWPIRTASEASFVALLQVV